MEGRGLRDHSVPGHHGAVRCTSGWWPEGVFLFSEITLFFLFLTSKGIQAQGSSCLNHRSNDSPHPSPDSLIPTTTLRPSHCTKKQSNAPLSHLKPSNLNPFAALPPCAASTVNPLQLHPQPCPSWPLSCYQRLPFPDGPHTSGSVLLCWLTLPLLLGPPLHPLRLSSFEA